MIPAFACVSNFHRQTGQLLEAEAKCTTDVATSCRLLLRVYN